MRIDKMISNSGHGSRSEIKKYLKYGNVKVNGEVVKAATTKVDIEKDLVELFRERIIYKKNIYLIMNKPAGVVSATKDNSYETVIDLLDDFYKSFNPFPVGRLDIDTEGLLLITNDGKFSYNLLSPKKHVPKTYYALIDAPIDENDVSEFKKGLNINDEYITKPAILDIINSGENESEIHVTIEEGKYHQVKRMFKSSGKHVTYLKRIKMANLELDENLKNGEYREISEEEMELLNK
ncbi:pseudouridine synthase [Helicovermis profundi]